MNRLFIIKTFLISFYMIISWGIIISDSSSNHQEISHLLNLNDGQSASLREIVQMADHQRELDIKNHKNNGAALVETAKIRQRMVDIQLEKILDPNQKIIFSRYKINRKKSEELFILTEGLLLNLDQQKYVEGVLDDYEYKLEEMRETINNMRDMIGSQPPKGGGMRMGSNRSGSRGTGWTPGRGTRSNPMDTMKKQKIKDIKKALDKEQKKRLKQIEPMLEQEMKKKMREYRKRRDQKEGELNR